MLVCLAVLAGSPAHAARQLRADDPPAAEGPLYDPIEQCNRQTLESDAGEPVVKVHFCIFFYSFDTLSELDVNNEYGVVWAQATFDALPGYCTSELSFYVEVSPGTTIHGRTPPKPKAPKRPTTTNVEVAATAGGTALQEGLVSQRLKLLPGKMTPLAEGTESRVGLSWKGRSPDKLAFATGAEIGWPMLEAPPQMKLGTDTIRLVSGKGC